MQIAETKRLILRELTIDDADDFYRIYTDEETMRFQAPLPEDYSPEVERLYIGRHAELYYDKVGFGIWAVVEKETDRVIGRSGLVRQPLDGEEVVEITYLLDRAFWGKGLATEAAHATLMLAFDQFELERLYAFIHPENNASRRVAEKIGMRFDRNVEHRGFGDVCLYSIDEGDIDASLLGLNDRFGQLSSDAQ